MTPSHRTATDQLRSRIRGPVLPIPTPFTVDLVVDLDATQRYVGWLVEEGVTTVITTIGTSRFNLLSREEILDFNAAVAAAAGNAVAIVANGPVGDAAEGGRFAEHAQKCGADALLVYFPERHYGDDNTFEYFATVAAAVDLPVLIHEMPMRNGLGAGSHPYSLELIDRLLEIDNVIGLKEEALDVAHSQRVVREFVDRAVVVGAGGGMSRYLERDFAFGASAYLGGIGNFVPAIEHEFFAAMHAGECARAEQIVTEVERDFFAAAVPMGWHPALKRAMALKGLMPPYERGPMKNLSAQEEAALAAVMQRHHWL